jgi:cation transport ATPase
MIDPGRHPAAVHDVRDDFDDEFAHAQSRREVVRRRLFAPAVAIVATGALGIPAVFCLAAGSFIRHYGRNTDISDSDLIALLLALLVVGWALFAIVIAGGVSMLRQRRYRLALVAAYVVTGLSLAGCYGILFYPFGIWALILLYRPDVRHEFGRPAPVDD